MSGWSPNTLSFIDLLGGDAEAPPNPSADPPGDAANFDYSPLHRRPETASTPPSSQPRSLFPAHPYPPYPPYQSYGAPPAAPTGAPPPAPTGAPPPFPFGPYGYPPYGFPPPSAPTGAPTAAPTGAPPPFPFGPYGYPPYGYPPYGYHPAPAPTARPSGDAASTARYSSGGSEGAGTTEAPRPRASKKRNEWTASDEEKLVNAWLLHSKDCIDGNSKSGQTFWGGIAETYNATTEPERYRTPKQLKDHWSTGNAKVSLFNSIYNQESSHRASGADDLQVMEAAKERYKLRAKHPFKHFTWWQAVRYEPKWSNMHGEGPTIDVSKRSRLGVSGEYSSGDHDTEESVSRRPMGRDRAKAAAGRGKGKEKAGSSRGSGSTEMSSDLSGLSHITREFKRTQLWKQWTQLMTRSTSRMSKKDKARLEAAKQMLDAELGLNVNAEEEDEEEEDENDENAAEDEAAEDDD